jgi:hypothetical protein
MLHGQAATAESFFIRMVLTETSPLRQRMTTPHALADASGWRSTAAPPHGPAQTLPRRLVAFVAISSPDVQKKLFNSIFRR